VLVALERLPGVLPVPRTGGSVSPILAAALELDSMARMHRQHASAVPPDTRNAYVTSGRASGFARSAEILTRRMSVSDIREFAEIVRSRDEVTT
jgi:hypothetical protein